MIFGAQRVEREKEGRKERFIVVIDRRINRLLADGWHESEGFRRWII